MKKVESNENIKDDAQNLITQLNRFNNYCTMIFSGENQLSGTLAERFRGAYAQLLLIEALARNYWPDNYDKINEIQDVKDDIAKKEELLEGEKSDLIEFWKLLMLWYGLMHAKFLPKAGLVRDDKE